MSQIGKCSHCGSPLQEGMRFCWNCGTERKNIPESIEQLSPNNVNRNPEQQSRSYAGADRQTVNRVNIDRNPEQQSRPYVGADQQTLSSAYANRNAERQRQRLYAGAEKPSGDGRYTNRNTVQPMNVQRYKQEEMEHDWQQSWNREEEDDGSFTLIQYVLIGIAVVLLMALVGFGVYWVLGKSTGNTGRRPDADQERIEQIQTSQEETERKDAITILDDTRDELTKYQTEKQDVKAEEKQTEKQDVKVEEKQTEKQSVKAEEKQTEKQTEKLAEADAEIPEIEIISEDYYVIEAPTGGSAEMDYSGGYIPESSQRVLTDADVVGMTYDDLQMAINEIYARHGRIFRSEAISSYFNSQPWYQGTVTAENFNEGVFNSVESQNIQFLLDKMGN